MGTLVSGIVGALPLSTESGLNIGGLAGDSESHNLKPDKDAP